jgi:hypothetical protein
MKNYNVTIAFEDGTYSHTNNLKAENKTKVLENILADSWIDTNKVVSITITEKKIFNG